MKFRLTATLLSICLYGSAFAIPVLDQNQPLQNGGFSQISNVYNAVQTFQQSANNVSGGGFFLDPTGYYFTPQNATGNFIIGVFSADPVLSPSSLLASGTGSGQLGTWVDAFWAPISVAPNTTLYLSIKDTASTGYFSTTSMAPGPYANGSAGFANPPIGSDYSYFDLAFRTYSESSFTGSPVPDTVTTVGLIGFALFGIIAWRRKFVR